MRSSSLGPPLLCFSTHLLVTVDVVREQRKHDEAEIRIISTGMQPYECEIDHCISVDAAALFVLFATSEASSICSLIVWLFIVPLWVLNKHLPKLFAPYSILGLHDWLSLR